MPNFQNIQLMQMYELLGHVDGILDSLVWSECPVSEDQQHEARFRALVGLAPDWRVVVSEFDIEPQGFPPGSMGYDGAASCSAAKWPGPAIVHLTRELAQKAFKVGDAAVRAAAAATSKG